MGEFIVFIGVKGSGKTTLAKALAKTMENAKLFLASTSVASNVEQLEKAYKAAKEGVNAIVDDGIIILDYKESTCLPTIFIIIQNFDKELDDDFVLRVKALEFARMHSIPVLYCTNIPSINPDTQARFITEYLRDRRANQDMELQEKIDNLHWYFTDTMEDAHFTWAMEYSPLALEMFFDKTRKGYIPLSIASITSMISRCIENNLDKSTFKKILDFSRELSITGPLYLRRVRNMEFLLMAASYGFHDAELTKRIVLMQRQARKEPLIELKFEGRQPGDSAEYYGYRHAMYFTRYSGKDRLKLFTHCNYKDCNWQGYHDTTGDEIPEEVCNSLKLTKK